MCMCVRVCMCMCVYVCVCACIHVCVYVKEWRVKETTYGTVDKSYGEQKLYDSVLIPSIVSPALPYNMKFVRRKLWQNSSHQNLADNI